MEREVSEFAMKDVAAHFKNLKSEASVLRRLFLSKNDLIVLKRKVPNWNIIYWRECYYTRDFREFEKGATLELKIKLFSCFQRALSQIEHLSFFRREKQCQV